MSNRKLIIEVFFDTPENMERSFNRAVKDMSKVLKEQGCVDMELIAHDIESPGHPIYNVTIKDHDQ
jgi:hypothetical protein